MSEPMDRSADAQPAKRKGQTPLAIPADKIDADAPADNPAQFTRARQWFLISLAPVIIALFLALFYILR